MNVQCEELFLFFFLRLFTSSAPTTKSSKPFGGVFERNCGFPALYHIFVVEAFLSRAAAEDLLKQALLSPGAFACLFLFPPPGQVHLKCTRVAQALVAVHPVNPPVQLTFAVVWRLRCYIIQLGFPAGDAAKIFLQGSKTVPLLFAKPESAFSCAFVCSATCHPD